MRARAAAVTALVLAVVGCTGGDPGAAPTGGASQPAATGSSAPPLDALRAGGLVIVFRHAATDQSRPDRGPVDLADCATQRNLSDAGRADARAIGAAFQDLGIPVGTVWTSPYCRARDTAQLAFGRGEMLPGLERLYPGRDQAADRRTGDLIRQHAPAAGQPNLVLAAHGVYPSVLSPPVTLAEGEAAVYSVTGDQVRLLGRVLPRQWPSLAATASASGEQTTADRVLDSVVLIHAANGRTGTGFRVAVPGLIVTAASVIASNDTMRVVLRDGTERSARVLGRSSEYDVAALQVDDVGLPALYSGSGLADAGVGNRVLPARSPPEWTVVTALEARAVRIAATLSPEAIGAPLVDRDGQVLGMITSASSALPVGLTRQEALRLAGRS
ncbi:trypsin-like peptidase domain-containing protein [Plantactinospora sp. CA-294935]|uniref:trypsin-like peptidase domain-containing protein n=1 Tax=Plantactinospora sp. CA-294935 TaxID=3240012 RepID=UPI003D8BF453